MSNRLSFDEPQIQRMFGHEAAEDEDIDRLREYYFKTATYDQAVTNLPLRILVGHKGIGKSALFQVAMAEDRDNHKLAILIKPDDVLGYPIHPPPPVSYSNHLLASRKMRKVSKRFIF